MDDIDPPPHSIGGIVGPDHPVMAQESQAATNETSTHSQQKVPKRRTKTGCLTCRQRRIKCGEEKPICNNCVKSKRECKGYAQRLVFKDPVGISESSQDGPTLLHSDAAEGLTRGYHAPAFSQPRPAGSQPPLLAPRPTRLPADGKVSWSTDVNPGPAAPLLCNQSSHPSHPMPGASMEDHMSQAWPQAPRSNNDLPETYTKDYTQFTAHYKFQAGSEPTPPSRESPEKNPPYEPSSYLVDFCETEYAEGDDFYDVETDEESEFQVGTRNLNQLTQIMASASRDDGPPRSFTTYLNEPNVLASYRPSLGSSPLNNHKTARIFLHFIHSTGPSISIFERHPIDPSTMFGAPVPIAQQGLWTYTLPFNALEHQALLQAILALSSLHIAYLQQAPPTVSLKHYHYALKRVGVAVGLPTRRKQVGTLAAALLLAYYEVMSADHTKWNSHVAGAVQLLREIDFATITRDLRLHRRETWARRQINNGYFLFGSTVLEDDPFAEQESNIDENLIGSILGYAVNYDEFGSVHEGHARHSKPCFTRNDIESFRIQCDLYWWCCKQDIIQSIIGGNPLFIAFSRLGQCPPRAGIGRLDAIYGSADHLWLLLGRLTDFGYRDRRRKLKTCKAGGADWRPGPDFSKFMTRFAQRPPGKLSPFQNDSTRPNPTGKGQIGRETTGSTSQSPPMFGMIPSSGPRHPPSAFTETKDGLSSPEEDEKTDMSYSNAEQEWENILSAFEMFSHALGPHFLPLPADSAPPIATPFGPALQYRTQTIAVIWGFYYLGRILLHRLHPCMPPAMMVASGVAAPATAEYSQVVGKIAAGIYYPQSFNIETGNLSPTLGSCLIEITVPIFFAAVQYTDKTQRHWIATRLREITRLTGWRSSDAIADGIERAWRTAAAQGRGPPYEPPSEGGCQPVPLAGAPASTVTERRFVTVEKPYLRWAVGILGLEEELLRLEIEDRW
ncbi:hypothetical protein BDV59DRAFT_168887 [Aspergillus ambiguus]|uniref:putative C6 finger domain protein n=1 Tax=Aspergillus ambiguus TaxID=176160 RepID=UPI003CCDB4A9